ncbi:MAG: hypothetical protein QOE61_482 [Micromonosporaceae bacterium]|nr:hypothetical protein [Micromonosporaceae bacterium]
MTSAHNYVHHETTNYTRPTYLTTRQEGVMPDPTGTRIAVRPDGGSGRTRPGAHNA